MRKRNDRQTCQSLRWSDKRWLRYNAAMKDRGQSESQAGQSQPVQAESAMLAGRSANGSDKTDRGGQNSR